jgi:hypothetical protein
MALMDYPNLAHHSLQLGVSALSLNYSLILNAQQ